MATNRNSLGDSRLPINERAPKRICLSPSFQDLLYAALLQIQVVFFIVPLFYSLFQVILIGPTSQTVTFWGSSLENRDCVVFLITITFFVWSCSHMTPVRPAMPSSEVILITKNTISSFSCKSIMQGVTYCHYLQCKLNKRFVPVNQKISGSFLFPNLNMKFKRIIILLLLSCINLRMDLTPGTPQRSKSFKALSMAQPIRKDIEQTLNQLEQQKRRYLASDREEALLKQQLQRKRDQLILLKKQVPVTETDQKRTTQTNLKLKNTDRTYETTLGNIQKLKQEIDTARKRVSKLKIYNEGLFNDQQQLSSDIDKLVEDIVNKQKANEDLKLEIVNYRDINIKNLKEFQKSHMNLTKSNFKDENQRRKFAVSTRTFLGDESKKSRMVHYDKISDALKNSGIVTNEGRADVLAQSVPIAKSRVNVIIHQNKQKIRIAENYMKFGQGLQNLFNIIKEYKGRDDVDYIADQFVKKEKQIQKLGEYIGKLEYQIVSSRRQLAKKESIGTELERNLTTDNHNVSEKHYKEMAALVKDEIAQLKAEHVKMNDWLKQVAEILCPLAGDEDFSRGNAVNVMGKLEEKLGINRANVSERKSESPTKSHPAPPVQPEDLHQKYAQLLSYQKMKDYADEYIKNKKSP